MRSIRRNIWNNRKIDAMSRTWGSTGMALLIVGVLTLIAAGNGSAAEAKAGGAAAPSKQDDLQKTALKLGNPAADIWALQTEFGLTTNDGDANTGDPEWGSSILFEPVLPVPVWGKGDNQWKVIVRPSIPFFIDQPFPKEEINDFKHKTGLGDMFLPFALTMPNKRFILSLGPTFYIPTATSDELGNQQWGIGPTFIAGIKTKKIRAGIFPQYWWRVADTGGRDNDTRNLNQGSMLAFFWYSLPDAWNVGYDFSTTYNHNAPSDNKWTVPVGLKIAKTVKIGTKTFKFMGGLSYNVVSEKEFGQRVSFVFDVIPVIQSAIKKPLFGGD